MDGCDWSASSSDHFLVRKRAVCNGRKINLVGHETGLAAEANRKAPESTFNKILKSNLISFLKHGAHRYELRA
jgi:hypothetical protein